MDRALFGLVCIAAMGSGIVGGIFYGFSSFVMKALGRIAPEQGVAAMNSISVVVINPSFMLPFMGTTLICVALAAGSYLWWDQLSGKLVLVAALLYLAGSFGLTMVLHQPMNLKLAALQPAQAVAYWPAYVEQWTLWNHVRTAAPLLSAALFVAALMLKRQGLP
jgi:uncharacterized membrane protein